VIRPRRLISIAHSYVVGLNRHLAWEIAQAGAPRWEVTVVAPQFYTRAAESASELCRSRPLHGRQTGL